MDIRPAKRRRLNVPDLFLQKPWGQPKDQIVEWWLNRSEQEETVMPWARDVFIKDEWQVGKKAYFVDTHMGLYQTINSLPESFRTFYECVGDQFGYTRLIIDLDIKREQLDGSDPSDLNGVNCLLRKVITVIIERAKEDFSIDLTPSDFFLTCAGYKHSEDVQKQKNSVHITCPAIVFEYIRELGIWLMVRVAPELPPNTIDKSIYGNMLVRVPYATKGGECRHLQPYLLTFESGITTANVSEYGLAGFWIRCMVKTFEEQTIRYETTTQVSRKTIASDQQITFSFTKGSLVNLTSEKTETLIEGLQILVPKIDWKVTSFTCRVHIQNSEQCYICIRPTKELKCLCIDHTHSSPKSYIILGSKSFVLKCFNSQHNCNISFYPTRNKKVDELVRLVQYYKITSCLEQLLENVQPKKCLLEQNDQTIILRETTPQLQHISYVPLLEHQKLTMFVDANMKLGKSGECRQQLIEILERNPKTRFVFLVHRRALAHHTFTKVKNLVIDPLVHKGLPLLPFELYLDIPVDSIKYSCVISVESQRRLDFDIPVDLLILDEVESIIPQTRSETNRKSEHRESENNAIFNRLISDTPHLWAIDAELSEETIWFFGHTRQNDYRVYHQNVYTNWQGTTVILYATNSIMLHTFMQKVANQGERVYGCFAQKKFMTDTVQPLLNYISNGTTLKYQCYTSETDEITKKDHLSNVDQKWTDFDVICTTSTIQAGTSFEMKHFDHVFGFFGGVHGLKYEDMLQMLGRVRNIGSGTLHLVLNLPLLVSESKTNWLVDYDSIETNLLSSKHPPYKSRSEYPNVTPSYFATIHNIVKTNKSNNGSVPMIIQRFRQMGAEVVLAPWTPQRGDLETFTEELRSLSKEIREDRLSSIINSEELDQSTAEEYTQRLKIGIGITDEQRLALIKFSIRRYYGYEGQIDAQWFKTFVQPRVKRWFVVHRYLFYGHQQQFDRNTFVKTFAEHEHLLQKRYEQVLAGGELGKKFHSQQLEFVSLICEKLGFHFPNIWNIVEMPKLSYKEFDTLTDKWLVPTMHQFSRQHQRPILPTTDSSTSPIFYPSNSHNLEALHNAVKGTTKKIRTFLWNVFLSFVGLEFYVLNIKKKIVSLRWRVEFSIEDKTSNKPTLTPLILNRITKCLLDEIE